MFAVRDIGRRFDETFVLRHVSLEFRPGEIHALLGENGAGKSTLLRLLAGVLPPTEGHVEVDGKAVRWRGPRDAEHAGIVMIHQELNLALDLSVEANLVLGREPTRLGFLDRAAITRTAREALRRVGLDIDPRRPIHELGIAQRQLVEIARATTTRSRLLLLDEPTAVLDSRESERLFALLRDLTAAGTGCVYVSHRLDEIRALAHRLTILRDGAFVATHPAGRHDSAQLAELMVGRPLGDLFPPKPPAPSAPPLLEAHGGVAGWVDDAAFTVAPGEVLGFAGLVGSGRTELFEGLLGLRPGWHGTLRLDGAAWQPRGYADALRRGVIYLSEDRKGRGLHLDRPIRENIVQLALRQFAPVFLRPAEERRRADAAIAAQQVKVRSRDQQPRLLSGGNQQKVALARLLEAGPRLVVLDEPTRGVDVGTKAAIYRQIASLAARGLGVVVISSELPELIGLCHRVLVLHEGRVAGEVRGGDLDEVTLVRLATGTAAA